MCGVNRARKASCVNLPLISGYNLAKNFKTKLVISLSCYMKFKS